MQIVALGSCSQENILKIEEKYTISLDYDWGTNRVSVQLKFVKEGCYHATIKYKGTELHNGDFDIIVLNSQCFGLTHLHVSINVCLILVRH